MGNHDSNILWVTYIPVIEIHANQLPTKEKERMLQTMSFVEDEPLKNRQENIDNVMGASLFIHPTALPDL